MKRLLMSIVLSWMLLCVATCFGQDTMRISLDKAEQIFTTKNLSLLAERYNIDIARAQVMQARLYNNPNISFTGAAYNPDRKKVLDMSNQSGEYVVNIQQLITLAGKRNKAVALAKTNVSLSENRFFDLLRTLRFTLRSDFYQAYFLQRSINAYNEQISYLDSLSGIYEQLQNKGVVTLKDAVRIKALAYSLRAEESSLQNQLNDVEAELQLLLQNNRTWLIPEANIPLTADLLKKYPLKTLVDSAYANRADVLLAQNNVRYSEQNLTLQKAMAVPDLLVGGQFDKRGSYVDNATFFSVAMDLPFFNKNQGNISAARSAMEQSKLQLTQQNMVVENDVQKAYAKALNTSKLLSSMDPTFQNDFAGLLKSVNTNFQKRNISMLDFIDFYDSYKQNILQLNQLQNDRIQAIEALNYAIGKNMVNNY